MISTTAALLLFAAPPLPAAVPAGVPQDAGPPAPEAPAQDAAPDAAQGSAEPPAPTGPGSLFVVLDGGAAAPEDAEVTLELVDTLRGTFGDDDPPRTITATIGGGPVEIPMDLAPLDLRVAEEDAERWALMFLHGPRVSLDASDTDLLGRTLDTLAPEGEFVAVLAGTGVVALEVIGADEDDRFVATFIDERPEPDLHRPVRTSRTFRGPVGAMRFPPGRGRLHVAREDALGGLLCDARGPLSVAVRSGATTSLRIEMTEGPTTMIKAPFEAIPFEVLDALAPDGETLVGAFPFASTPLRLPSALPRVAGSEVDGAAIARMTRMRQLVRGRDVPLERVEPPVFEGTTPPEYRLATAPLDLTFGIQHGDSLRLPEVDGGWVTLARSGIAGMERLGGRGGATGVERPGPGVVQLAGDATRGARLRVVRGDGSPVRFAEVIVAPRRRGTGGSVRAVTDAAGVLELRGLGAGGAVVCLPGAPGARVELEPGGEARLTAGAAVAHVAGLWEGAAPGLTMALLAPDEDERSARDPFGSSGFAVAATDHRGRFDFGAVEPGTYRLQILGGGDAEVVVPAAGARLAITGAPGAPEVSVE